jgi:hypothetical protein
MRFPRGRTEEELEMVEDKLSNGEDGRKKAEALSGSPSREVSFTKGTNIRTDHSHR